MDIWTETVINGQVRRRRVSTGTADWPKAEQFRAQFIAGLNNAPPPDEPTIAYLLERYRCERGPQMRAEDTLDFGIAALLLFFGQLLPRHVTNLLLRQFAEQHRNLSAGTILRRLGILKAALRYAEGNRWIEPLPPLRMPLRHPAPRDIWLTKDHVFKLIDRAASPHIALFIKLAVSTAARSGAILELKWQQVDLKAGIIDFGKGWGNKRRAIVPINEDAADALRDAQKLAQTDYVTEFAERPVKSIKTAFRRLCKTCDIEASPHVLSHTAATWTVMDGVPLSEVARLLGNSEAMVEKVYGNHSPEYLRRAVRSLGFRRTPTTPQI
jgi:integrase